VLQILRKYSQIIRSYKIIRFEQFGKLLRLRAEVNLIDDSKLYIRETVIEAKRKYAYHWHRKDDKLIIRWDNAPDWEVETFPHHKHFGDKREIEPSYERTLEQVLDFISQQIMNR
jgi:hypothetical protein